MLPYLMEAADGTRDADAKDLKNQRGESKNRLLETEPVWQSTNNFDKPSAQSLHGNISPFKTMTSSNGTNISVSSSVSLRPQFWFHPLILFFHLSFNISPVLT